MNMKVIKVLAAILTACQLLCGCSGQSDSGGKVLAEVGDYKLRLEEFERSLADEVEMNPSFKLTQEARTDHLDQMIEKEVLILEAKRRQLDVQPKFIRTIERYWESTLIRDLMDVMGEEFEGRVVVTQEEIAARYEQLKAEDPSMLSLSEMETEIRDIVREEKKTRAFTQWLEELKSKTPIKINKDILTAE